MPFFGNGSVISAAEIASVRFRPKSDIHIGRSSLAAGELPESLRDNVEPEQLLTKFDRHMAGICEAFTDLVELGTDDAERFFLL